jgi:hypothetical protein
MSGYKAAVFLLCPPTFIDPVSYLAMRFSFVFAVIATLTMSVSVSACQKFCNTPADCCAGELCQMAFDDDTEYK